VRIPQPVTNYREACERARDVRRETTGPRTWGDGSAYMHVGVTELNRARGGAFRLVAWAQAHADKARRLT
jgi:hypothetical protein